ncbi:MAG: hypothetical protein ACI920_002784, partial [Saprospiraceae bacterium]
MVTNEWLYGKKEKNMRVLFQRKDKEVIINNLVNKAKIPSKLPYQHSLYLKHAAAFDESGKCQLIRNYFKNCFTSNFSATHEGFRWLSMIRIEDNYKRGMLQLL